MKILKVSLGIMLTALLLWGIYAIWQAIVNAPPTANLPVNNPVNRLTGIPGTADLPAASKFGAETKNPVFDFWINSLTGTLYYLSPNGQVFRKTANGEELINSQALNQLNKVLPSPDGTSAIAEFNYPERPTFSVFNTVTGSWRPLPENTVAAAWATSSQQLAYLENKNGAGSLKILNTASQKTQEIIKINLRDARLYWNKPSQILILVSAPTVNYPSSLWSVDLKSKKLANLVKEENGLNFTWSSNSNFGLKFSVFRRVPNLSLVNETGTVLSDFTFLTLPEKCVFEGPQIYCAVPRFLKDGLILPDDYYKGSVYFQDDLYVFAAPSGRTDLIFSGQTNLIDARSLTLNNNKLYFINRYDNLVYGLSL